jgi:glycosyltransferase involved in cell wall biosynthesis
MSAGALAPFGRAHASLSGRTILQVIPRLDAGGAERTTLDVANALVRAGARALVASEGGRLASELQAIGGVLVPFPAATKNPLAMLLNVRKLARLIVAERVDLVHARSRAPAWVALGACRIAERPFVTTYHGAYSGVSMLKLRYNSVMARGDIVIANSQYTADMIARLYPEARDRLGVFAGHGRARARGAAARSLGARAA